MTVFEVEDCLKSMQVIVDTREQPSKRAEERYKAFGVPYKRQGMAYGDYTYNFTLPNGKPLYGDSESIHGHCVIERKADLTELAGNFCERQKDSPEAVAMNVRNRFEAEFKRATQNGAKIYLLVEDANWENLLNGKYRTKFNSKAFFASITAWMARYNISVIFCKSETSGILIKEILYRELKHRLEGGFYG